MAKVKKVKQNKRQYVLFLSQREAEALGALVLNVEDGGEKVKGPIWRIFHALYEDGSVDLHKYDLFTDESDFVAGDPISATLTKRPKDD